jgi:uncharacterized surface protein with fasciclin (FAS1) repeats
VRSVRVPHEHMGDSALSTLRTDLVQHARCNDPPRTDKRTPMRQISIALITSALLVSACSDHDDSVYEQAKDDPSLSTFVAAVQFASTNNDLVNLLTTKPSTLTVFAPINQGFDALAVEITGNPSAVGTDLLIPSNQALLHDVLLYHIVQMTIRAADFPFGLPIQSVEGNVFKIDSGSPAVITDGRNRTTNIIATDVNAENGVLHKIDHVLLPPNLTIGQTVQGVSSASGDFTIVLAAVNAAQLAGVLQNSTAITVFVPTDAAFESLIAELGSSLPTLLASPQFLVQVLSYHVIAGEVFKAALPIGTPITTLQAGAFTIDQSLVITDARGRTAHIIKTDVLATNGVFHVIDRVLLPATTQ